jgi:hypothetical protein
VTGRAASHPVRLRRLLGMTTFLRGAMALQTLAVFGLSLVQLGRLGARGRSRRA